MNKDEITHILDLETHNLKYAIGDIVGAMNDLQKAVAKCKHIVDESMKKALLAECNLMDILKYVDGGGNDRKNSK